MEGCHHGSQMGRFTHEAPTREYTHKHTDTNTQTHAFGPYYFYHTPEWTPQSGAIDNSGPRCRVQAVSPPLLSTLPD